VDVSFVQYLFVLVSRGFNRICFGWKIKPQDGLNPYRDQVEGRGFTQSLSGLNTPRDFTPPSRTKPGEAPSGAGSRGRTKTKSVRRLLEPPPPPSEAPKGTCAKIF
jgi:hypothetical protein